MTNPTGSILVRRGPTTDRNGFYPLPGEIIYDTTTNRFHVGDGVTAGGVSINQRDFPNPGVMIKGLTTDSYLVAPGNTSGTDYQFLVYSKVNGQYEFSSITSSGVAVTSLTLSGANGITVTRTDTDPDQSNPTITTIGQITFDVNASTLRTTLSVNNVTNESKATMFTSPTFTGIPVAPTATAGTNTTQLATTEFVKTAVSNLINGAPGALDTLNELAAALGNDANYASTITTALSLKAPLDSPTFTGTVSGITATMVGLSNVTNESKATMFTSPTFTGHATIEGQLLTGVTGTGKLVLDNAPTISGHLTIEGVTSTGATGTGKFVFDSSPAISTPTITTPTISGYTETAVTSVTVGTGTTAITDAIINSGTILRYTLTASQATTFTMPTATAGKSFVILIKQPATGGVGTASFTGVVWSLAGAPTITATVGKLDILTFIADGSKWYGSANQGYTY